MANEATLTKGTEMSLDASVNTKSESVLEIMAKVSTVMFKPE